MINDVSASQLTSISRQTQVITGFNTDIVYQGITYHIQTEDKGLKTPLILSLVYDRGTILASKRSPYNDLLEGDFDEKELTERLQKQHKLICAAVRAGRIEDLKQMTLKESAAKKAGLPVQQENPIKKPLEPLSFSEKTEKSNDLNSPKAHQIIEAAEKVFVSAVSEKTTEVKTTVEDIYQIPADFNDEFIFEEAQIVEDDVIIPADAVEVIADPTYTQVSNNNLKIEFLDNMVFKSGEQKTLTIMIRRGNSQEGLSGAHVMVKIIGASFYPLVFHTKTDNSGVAVVPMQLPTFRAGRAAILVKAMCGGEETELRRAIQSR